MGGKGKKRGQIGKYRPRRVYSPPTPPPPHPPQRGAWSQAIENLAG